MATTMLWVFYDVVLFVVGLWFVEHLNRNQWILVGGLAVLGVALGVYGFFSDQANDKLIRSLKEGQAYNTGQLDTVVKLLGPKVGASDALTIAKVASAKIDSLQAEIEAENELKCPNSKPTQFAHSSPRLPKLGLMSSIFFHARRKIATLLRTASVLHSRALRGSKDLILFQNCNSNFLKVG